MWEQMEGCVVMGIHIIMTVYRMKLMPYNVQVWSPYQSNCDKIEFAQRYFSRKLQQYIEVLYEERLSRLNLESLKSRRIKADLLLYYKVSNSLININTEGSIRPFNNHRGHNKNLYHFYSRTEARKNFWANRIVTYWNKLNINIVNSKSIVEFKKKMKCITF